MALGPLSSQLVGSERGRRDFYVSFAAVLDTIETITGTPTATSGNAAVIVDNVAANTVALTDCTRSVAIGKAVQFRATTDDDLTDTVEIDVHIVTTDGNYDTAMVELEVVETLVEG